MMYNVIILHAQDLFVRLHENDQWAFSKKSLWGPFSKPAFLVPKSAVYFWTEKKILVFKVSAIQSRLLNIGLVLFIINIILLFIAYPAILNSQLLVNYSSVNRQLLARLRFDSTIEAINFRPYRLVMEGYLRW